MVMAEQRQTTVARIGGSSGEAKGVDVGEARQQGGGGAKPTAVWVVTPVFFVFYLFRRHDW